VIAQTPVATPDVDLWPVLPEIVLLVTAVLGLLYEAFARRSSTKVHLVLVFMGLVAAGGATLLLWDWTGAPTVLGDTVQVDRFGVVARFVLLTAALVGALYIVAVAGREPSSMRGEAFPLLVLATSGMTLIVVANDLIVTFLALEILSLALYVLTGITGRASSIEASVKYFLLGAFSSAFFLFGIAMAYGAAATTKIDAMASALSGSTGSQALALTAVALLAVGFGFKVSAAPFHMWTPDVYQGAPTPITAFMSAATKAAAFFALTRVLLVAFHAATWDWTPVVATLAVISIVVGSVLAIAQRDVKRMLAYSSIAHAGFVLTALVNPETQGIRATIFYLAVYSAMTLGAFGVVMLIASRGEERTDLASYDGLARRSPGLAALMTVFLLSLAGIPPTGGFIAKVGVFTAATSAGYWWLALVGVIMSVVAAFFYLRVIVAMTMRPSTLDAEDPPGWPRVLVGALAIAVVVIGVFPGLLTGVIDQAATLGW
jgi:NADH-quinone oxidoreductase subunit N